MAEVVQQVEGGVRLVLGIDEPCPLVKRSEVEPVFSGQLCWRGKLAVAGDRRDQAQLVEMRDGASSFKTQGVPAGAQLEFSFPMPSLVNGIPAAAGLRHRFLGDDLAIDGEDHRTRLEGRVAQQERIASVEGYLEVIFHEMNVLGVAGVGDVDHLVGGVRLDVASLEALRLNHR